jgi:hypothetical protein
MNLAVRAARTEGNVAVIDLDIANPYFRSRESEKKLNDHGVRLVSNAYGYDITADLPSLSAAVKSFLGNKDYHCIVDAGGNDSGARVLTQYKNELNESAACFYMVVNVYRPETDTAGKVIGMIHRVEAETGKQIDGLINNSNLLRETESIDILRGFGILDKVSSKTGIPIVANCAEERFAGELYGCGCEVVPISLYMRPRWLDM